MYGLSDSWQSRSVEKGGKTIGPVNVMIYVFSNNFGLKNVQETS